MANDNKFVVKNGLQTPNIDLISPDRNHTIAIDMLNTDTLSISGNSGQLFSITDSLTGTIFAVNDISGVPSIEVDDDGEIRFAETFGNVLIGTAIDDGSKLQVNGNATIAGTLAITGNVTVTGTIDGRDVSVDGAKLDGIAAGAEVNQNAFSNIAVSGQTTVAADSKTDTLTLIAGTNVTITTDAVNDSITISANDTSVDWSEIQNKPDPVVTVTLTGDVTGSGNTTLTDLTSGTISFATTIAANSVELGTDTTGNYVAGITAGGGITVTGTAGEGWSPTIAHSDTSSVANVASNNANAVVIQDVSFTFDTYGHVTAATVGTVDLDGRYYTETEADNRFVNVTGDTMSGDLTINGTLSATAKSFLIPHPTKEGKKLRHGSLEGPEHGVYIRGKIKGGVIELPEYWAKLVNPDSITVQLTAIGKGQKLYVEDIIDNKVFINNDGLFASEPYCFYLIQAERIDIDKMDVEVE